MIDLTIIKDMTEILGKSLSFPDVEAIGKYFFKDFSTHKLEKISDRMTISSLTAAGRVVEECNNHKKIEELLQFIIELDGNPLNGKTVKLIGLENLLFRLSRTGIFFDFKQRKFVKYNEDKETLNNWGALKDNKEYPMIIASIDIVSNSELVKKYKPAVMEKAFYKFWAYIKNKVYHNNGRIWTWAGDGGIIAFRIENGISNAFLCCFEILLTMPILNAITSKIIQDELQIRIGIDAGAVKFASDTGRIISDVINYAAHLEKKLASPNGIAISKEIYNGLDVKLQKMFNNKSTFEERTAYSMILNFGKSVS